MVSHSLLMLSDHPSVAVRLRECHEDFALWALSRGPPGKQGSAKTFDPGYCVPCRAAVCTSPGSLLDTQGLSPTPGLEPNVCLDKAPWGVYTHHNRM